jgi:PIN domain nuclease of toxin-antitoxin system
MEAVYLDTHVAAWLYGAGVESLPSRTRRLVADAELLISPMVFLELQILYEIGRVAQPAEKVITALHGSCHLKICPEGFSAVVLEAQRLTWTRDPFDRLIVAQAALQDAVLVSKDHLIAKHYRRTRWE